MRKKTKKKTKTPQQKNSAKLPAGWKNLEKDVREGWDIGRWQHRPSPGSPGRVTDPPPPSFPQQLSLRESSLTFHKFIVTLVEWR